MLLAGCNDAPGDAAKDAPPPNPLLYEIASADGTVEGWMLGTIHALPEGIDWRTPEISQVIDTADFLVVEIGEPKGRDEYPSIYFSLARSDGLPPLATRLPPELRPQLAAMLARGGMEAEDFAVEESWAAAITLARIDATGDPANGVDRALIDQFDDRQVHELEGLRGQLSIFDRLPEVQQRAMLAAVVRESETARKDPARLQQAWLSGDAATIEASAQKGFLADPALREALLTSRNRRWVDALIPMLANNPRPLVAVGTAHLVGPEGLVALIEARGYRVRRLP
ncbi:TraB/GumN family protein [Porphyrobacter sp. LM 6]|uniref:TraB/GumN family protein n=1 Tax=Porphyrobacter sp. LM 6 TaxID=1896196 RepID=UPI001681B114|nr:TraB/GumN family protein [Porphyrobacter sp. LM 6]